MTETVDILKLLDLEPIEVNLFRGRSPESRVRRVFGGQVIAQGLVAACRTVEGRLPHSLHAYFILAGDPSVPIIYEVGRLRDGRSFTTRRVTAIQHGQAIFSMIVSFHNNEEGYDHQIAMPDVPEPETLDIAKMLTQVPPDELPQPLQRILTNRDGIEIRPVNLDRYLKGSPPRDQYSVWMRGNLPLGDDPAMHQAVLAYISDMGLIDVALARYQTSVFAGGISAASLDHAIWFHRPFRADEWLLYSQDSPNANGGRGLARGSFFRRDGTLVASVAQEGLIRRMQAKEVKS